MSVPSVSSHVNHRLDRARGRGIGATCEISRRGSSGYPCREPCRSESSGGIFDGDRILRRDFRRPQDSARHSAVFPVVMRRILLLSLSSGISLLLRRTLPFSSPFPRSLFPPARHGRVANSSFRLEDPCVSCRLMSVRLLPPSRRITYSRHTVANGCARIRDAPRMFVASLKRRFEMRVVRGTDRRIARRDRPQLARTAKINGDAFSPRAAYFPSRPFIT